MDETCPISTEGWTRRVHLVREGGEGGGHLEELEGHEAVVGGGLGILVTWPGRVRCRLAGTSPPSSPTKRTRLLPSPALIGRDAPSAPMDRAATGWVRCRPEPTRRDRAAGNLEDG
jgi:hypothetical protein